MTRLNFQIFRDCSIQNIEDGTQIRVYKIFEGVVNFSKFISVKVKENLRKSQPQFQDKFRKMKLRHNDRFLIKK